jgi:hypothetical protein
MKQALVKGLVLTVIAATVQVVRAEEMLVLSARESDPGEVIVTFAVPATITPKADEVSLQLDNTPLIKAKAGSVSSLGSPAGPAWPMLCPPSAERGPADGALPQAAPPGALG